MWMGTDVQGVWKRVGCGWGLIFMGNYQHMLGNDMVLNM